MCCAFNTEFFTVHTPDDGQRNCPKHVEFYSKNKFEKLVHIVGFIVRIYHDARSPELQTEQIISNYNLYWQIVEIRGLRLFTAVSLQHPAFWDMTDCG